MENNNTIELKLGQKLYKYSSPRGTFRYLLLEYEVFGILEREEGRYYQIRCLSFTNKILFNTQDEVLIKLDDNKRFKYVSMLNEDDEEESQYFWHETEENQDYYCLSKKESLLVVYNRKIKACKDEISKLDKQIERQKEYIIDYEEKIKGLE